MSGATPPRPTVLLTGATDGIGLALARRLDARGARLVLSGRRPRAALADPLFGRARYVQADLERPAEAAATLAAALSEEGVERLDLLVHMAAVGSFAAVDAEPEPRVRAQLAVNLEAPIALTRALLPRVLAARGRVAFVSSVAAAAPAPDFAVYAATKAGLDGFARALRVELGRRASVVVLHPGATRTGIHVKSGASADEVARVARRWPSAERVATRLLAAIDRGGRQYTHGVANKVARWACGALPALVDRARRARLPVRPPTEPAGAPARVLVTGAADGLGRALAERWTAAGATVVGVDRDAERLASAPVAERHAADLGKAEQVADLAAALARGPGLDVAVFNAGVSCVGPLESAEPAALREVLAVNLAAPLYLTRSLLAAGRLRRGATLVFVASLSCYVGYPGAAAYAASKDALASYARSLRVALRPLGLNVLTVFPGPLRTAHARRYAPPGASEEKRMPPEVAAAQIVRAVARRRARLIPGLGNRVAARLGRLAPRAMDRLMRRLLFERLAPRSGRPSASGTR